MTAEQRGEANVPPDKREEETVPPDQREDGNTPRSGAGDEPEPEPESSNPDGTDDAYTDHLDDLPDGSGCTEIWEHLSEEREDDDRKRREDDD